MHIERFKIREVNKRNFPFYIVFSRITTTFKIYFFIKVASLVDGIDEGSLEFLVNALTELILNEDMAKKLRGG